jgi:hypothetical protein
VAFSSTYGGVAYDDWFLPSTAEAIEIDVNVCDHAGAPYTAGYLQTSTESSATKSGLRNIYANVNTSEDKSWTSSAQVWPIRRF